MERVVYRRSNFDGAAVIITYLNTEGVECVAYHNGETLEAYLFERPDLVVSSYEAFQEALASYLASLVTEIQNESEDEYYEALESLPPERYHDPTAQFLVFHHAERLQGRLVRWHAKHIGQCRYFTFIDFCDLTQAQLIQKLVAMPPN